MSTLTLVSAPAVEPIALYEARNFCKVDTDEDDDLIDMLITAARTSAEGIMNRALITQTWDYSIDAFPGWEQYLPNPALQSITSIKYVDSNGVLQTLAADQYLVDTKSEPARITPAFGLVWPVTRAQTNAVTIRFICGYGNASNVPSGIKNWILMRIRTLYDNRAQIEVGQGFTVLQLPNQYVDGLLNDYAVDSFCWALE